MNLWLVHTQEFYRHLPALLASRGHRISVVLTQERGVDGWRALVPDAVVISTFDAMCATLPPLPAAFGDAHPTPVSARTVEDFAACEPLALLMLDRLDARPVRLEDLRGRYLQYLAYWMFFRDRARPDAVVFHATPHMAYDYVLFHVCRAAGIPTLIVDRTYLDERLVLLSDYRDVPGPDAAEIAAEIARAGRSADPVQPDDQGAPAGGASPPTAQLDALNRKLNDVDEIENELSWWGIVRSVVNRNLPRSFSARVLSSANALARRRERELVFQLRSARAHVKARRALRYYDDHAAPPSGAEPFLFFPLQFQPERSTLPGAGALPDQQHIVDILVASLPAGWRLLVKEHPRQFRRGILWSKGRGDDFYERLVARPEVALAPLETSSRDLMAGCRAVATATGTAGWEAVTRGKPVLCFGYPWYARCPGVARVAGVDDCRAALARVADGSLRADPDAVAAYTRLLVERHSFRAAFSDRLLALSSLTPEANAGAYADAIDRGLRAAAAPLTVGQAVAGRP